MKYELRYEGGDVVTCDSCDCEAPTYHFNWQTRVKHEPKDPYRMLCEFCSTTMASRITEYQPPTDDFDALRREVWKAAASVYNMLQRDKTDKRRKT